MKKVTIKKAKSTKKKTIKKLKRKKKYYIRVRAYKTVKDKKCYGTWSKVKAVKTKYEDYSQEYRVEKRLCNA